MDIGKLMKSYHDMLLDIQEQKGSNGNVEHIKRYKILHSFRGTYIEKQMQKEEKMINPVFRVFEPVKPSRGRKLNIDPKHDFDPYSDSLLDYPSIISYKFKKPWQQYNRLICLHIPLCPNDCWHCYVPKELYIISEKNNHVGERTKLLTASEIIDHFIEQQRADGNEKPSNVLRITGGEPFLLPELILECLEELKKRELENKVFLWTETNLEPFVKKEGLNEGEEWEQREYNAFMDMDKNQEILTKLSEFNNLAVHPCFHGFDLSGDEFNLITGKQYNLTLKEQISGLRKLVKAGIDVYPTIGSNICDPTNLENLFNGLIEIHRNLPLRLAVMSNLY